MKEAIRQHALDLGFDDCRFTHAYPAATAHAFAHWLQAGFNGGMEWLARHPVRRVDPRQVLPQARTVVVLVASYQPGPGSPPPVRASSGPVGRVARYARAADYHHVLARPLRALAAHLDALAPSEHPSLCYVDTGPLLERDLAARAGAGFIGKHTNLISRKLGNWLFLAEILTPLEIEPDAAEPNRCGCCRRCLDACPTQAILAPFQLDARRCISYLTIELKGPIPEELRPAVGTRVFGCDDCLEVCPWNRFAREGRLMTAAGRPDLDPQSLLELLDLDEAGFRRQFAHTPILRAKRRGLLRNVCVALGNAADARALPALQRAAEDPEPLIAEHARWAIRQLEARATATRPAQPQTETPAAGPSRPQALEL